MMAVMVGLIFVTTIALAAMELWLFWRLGESDERRRRRPSPAVTDSTRGARPGQRSKAGGQLGVADRRGSSRSLWLVPSFARARRRGGGVAGTGRARRRRALADRTPHTARSEHNQRVHASDD